MKAASHSCNGKTTLHESHGIGDETRYCETHHGQWVRTVNEYVRSVEYGEVVIRIHGGKVVQVHKTEKVQFS